MTSDAGEFNFIVGDVQENTKTLDVECKWKPIFYAVMQQWDI